MCISRRQTATCSLCGSPKGFTLIELLIVVAIIGILASIAVPLTTVYRQQAFNTAALSDIKTLQRFQITMISEWQTYGLTTNTGASVVVLGNGTILQGSGGPNNGLACLQGFFSISLSQNVEIVANTNVAGNTFTMLSKHNKGTRIYGVDSDMSLTYFLTNLPSLTLTLSGINVAPVQSILDFPAGAGWSQF